MSFKEVSFSTLIGEIVDNRGKSCPTSERGIPLIATNCIRNELLYPTHENVRFVSRETYLSWFRSHPKPGDIIFVNKGTPGRVCLAPNPVEFCIAQDMVAIRPDEATVYPRYLFAALRSSIVQERIAQMHVGSLIPHFKKSDFDKLLIPVPAREEQVFIGDLYFSLSAKIDLNHRMSEALENIARAVFKSWFVDYRPVRQKAEGRRTELPTGIVDLFPKHLADSEIGPIPEGWRVTSLGDCVETIKGRSYKSQDLAESPTALVTLKSFSRGGGYRSDGLKPFTGTYNEEQVLEPGEVVIACTDVTQAAEVIGRAAIVRRAQRYKTLVASLDTMIVRPNSDRLSRAFLYCLGRTEGFVAHTKAHTTGTTVLHLAKEAIPSFRFACPPQQLVEYFDGIAMPALTRIQLLEDASETLVALRESLLPNFVSGRLKQTTARAEMVVHLQ